MAKKDKKYAKQSDVKNEVPQIKELESVPNVPKDVAEKLKAIKTKLESFQKKVLDKFDKYIVGIALMPPPKPEEMQQLQNVDQPVAPKPEDKDKIHVLVLVDDSDSKTMSKLELKDKLVAIVGSIATEIDPMFDMWVDIQFIFDLF